MAEFPFMMDLIDTCLRRSNRYHNMPDVPCETKKEGFRSLRRGLPVRDISACSGGSFIRGICYDFHASIGTGWPSP